MTTATRARYVVTPQIRSAVVARINELVTQAQGLGAAVSTPMVDYSLRGTTGGKMGRGVMYINVVLMQENWDDYVKNTIGHEFAHHICQQLYPFERVGHGHKWKHWMYRLGLDASRCHSYDVENAQVKKKAKYQYHCGGCKKDIFMGPVRHKKMVSGRTRYWCSSCGSIRGALTYVRPMGQVTYKTAKEKAAQLPKTPVKPLNIVRTYTATGTPAQLLQTVFATPPKPVVPVDQRSKKERAADLFRRVGVSRSVFISLCKAELGIEQATASTYHHNFKSGKWAVASHLR